MQSFLKPAAISSNKTNTPEYDAMISHLLRITSATALVVLLTFLPFLPGRYDSLAVPLLVMSQVIGKLGLLLVPVGALWMAFEYRSQPGLKRYAFAVTALIVSSVIWGFVSFVLIIESVALGLGVLGLGVYAVVRLLPRLKSLKGATPGTRSGIPVYLVTVPIAVVLIQIALADRAAEFSRSRAIRNSAPMIADIEAYRTANGRYPPSLMSMQPDYKPSVIGIKEYRYEPSGESYNLMFEQASFRIGTREIVMYNPSDKQAIASHALDVFQLTPEQLELDRSRGYNEAHDAQQPHWRYFWFD